MNFLIDFVINKNCDLDCKYCTSRASICSHDPYDFEQFKKDVNHFANLGINFEAILIGGEPFCNKDIFKYAEYINSLGKNIPVYIWTNGLYLSKAKEEIWKKISELKCILRITMYACTDIPYNDIFQKCVKYSIKYKFSHYNFDYSKIANRVTPKFRTSMQVFKYCESNTEEYKNKSRIRDCIDHPYESIPVCIRAYNGILYLCACFPMLSNIDKKFNSNLEQYLIENEDYIKIENIKSENDIDVTKVKFCKNHCRYMGEANWDKSKNERIEFFVEE